MLTTIVAAGCLVALCFFIHFAAMKRLANLVLREEPGIRRPLLLVLFALFAVHLLEVILYAMALSLLDWAGHGRLVGAMGSEADWIVDHFYFSIAAYTTLGIGDIVPHGNIRVVAGIESLNGLVLVAWSASFTYFIMERVWGDHAVRSRPHRAGRNGVVEGADGAVV